MSFSFFDHTGDIGVAVNAPTLPELFRDAVEAMSEAITDRAQIAHTSRTTVQLEAAELDLLLVDWLREALYEFEAHNLLIRTGEAIISDVDSAWTLRGAFIGERFDPVRHAVKVLVKAVTYHALEVKATANGWSAIVIFDI